MRHNYIDQNHFICCRCGELCHNDEPRTDAEMLAEYQQDTPTGQADVEHSVCDGCYQWFLENPNPAPIDCVAESVKATI